MIKLVIFDLDGVLIDSKDIHFEALNKALAYFTPHLVISKEDHLARFDGKSTKTKLDMLGIHTDLSKMIHAYKQQVTRDLLQDIPKNPKAIEVFQALKRDGIKVAVCSNAIRDTVDLALDAIGLGQLADHSIANDDVRRPKPSTEMYLRAMINADADPTETLIIEDSPVGRQGALNSGAHLLPVKDTHSWDKADVYSAIKRAGLGGRSKPWVNDKLNVVIPMAGAGSRFEKAGYTFPKPLIEVRGKPMIQIVVENLGLNANFIFICQTAHVEKYNLRTMLNLIAPRCKIITIDGITNGAACTVLRAEDFIDNDDPLIIANSDQFLEWNASDFYYSMEADRFCDAGIVTFKATHPKWSFAKIEKGLITQVAEKDPISDDATVGVYYWKHGSDFVDAAKTMIVGHATVNGEYYVAPVFNFAMKYRDFDGDFKIKPYQIEKMWGLGTPEDLNYFLENYKGNV